ncbi:MAG: hypothetical protein AAF633_04900, partial [Chloroflexota bacterium]
MSQSPSFFYQPGNGLLHRLNPLTKVVAITPILFYLALTTDPWTPSAFVLLATVTILVLGQIPIGRFLKLSAPMARLKVGYLHIYPL